MSEIEKMNRPPEKYAHLPNLWRVACELAKCKEPDKVLNALAAILSSWKEDGVA